MTKKTSFLLSFLIFAVTSGSAFSAVNYATEDYVDDQYIDVVGYVDSKNRTLKSTMNANDNQLFSNQEVLRDMLNARDADDNWIPLETDAKLAIPAINELNTKMKNKQDAISEDNLLPAELVSGLATVATTGSYSDLADKPEIPALDGLATSEELDTLRTTLEAAIEEKQAKGDYLTAESLTELNNAVTALQSGKADVSTVTALQNAINGLGDTYATDAELGIAIEGVKALIPSLADYAKTADVEAELALKEDVANKVSGATAEEISAMSSEEKATKYPSISVAQTIAAAAVTEVNKVAGDLSTLQTQVGTNTADITEIKGAGYQTAEQVSGAITTATADLASKSYVDTAIAGIEEYDDTALAGRVTANEGAIATNTAAIADNKSAIEALEGAGYQTADNVKTTVEGYGYQTAEQVSGAITTATADLATKADTLAGYGITDAYTKSEVDSAIGAIKEYDDTALAGRVTVNEGAIADNAGAITALETTVGDADSGLVKGVADNASAIEALQGAGYVVGTKTAGSYLVNFDANGNASYAAVEILDDKGAPIDLTVGAVK